MPRRRKAPRLYLRRARADRAAIWFIRDGIVERSTECAAGDVAGAERALNLYLAQKYSPPAAQPVDQLYIDQILATWVAQYVQHAHSRRWLMAMAKPISQWWAGKKLSEINGRNCREYVTWRTAQINQSRPKAQVLVSDQTARHELKALRSALRWFHAEHGPLPSIPAVTLPPSTPQKTDYWLSRKEVADRIRVARRNPYARHLIRLLLIGVYTGTRPGAVLRLAWMPSAASGYFDLDAETPILYRRGSASKRHSNKRQPPVRIHDRLLPHLRRWKAADAAIGCIHVVHYFGKPIDRMDGAWATVRELAGKSVRDTPHIIRHTAATWQMQAGTDIYEAAGYLGMSPETLWNTYGHHHPDFQSRAASAVPRRKTKRDHAPETRLKPQVRRGT